MKKKLLILLAVPLIIGTCKAQTTVSYETVTIALTSFNAALTALNASGITPKWQTKYTAGLAMLTGAGQLAYGIYEAGSTMTTLDIVNITVGTATIITNAILLYQTFHTGKTTSLNSYYTPVENNTLALGLRFVKKF
ncbi:MAG: hypothetical protein V1904_00820 [Bacteroidota bacterium]